MAGLQSIGLYSLNIPQEIFWDPETALRGTITLHFMLLQNEGIPEEPREISSEIFQSLSLGALELPFFRDNTQINVFSPRAGLHSSTKPRSPHVTTVCCPPVCRQQDACSPHSYCWVLWQQPGCSSGGSLAGPQFLSQGSMPPSKPALLGLPPQPRFL